MGQLFPNLQIAFGNNFFQGPSLQLTKDIFVLFQDEPASKREPLRFARRTEPEDRTRRQQSTTWLPINYPGRVSVKELGVTNPPQKGNLLAALGGPSQKIIWVYHRGYFGQLFARLAVLRWAQAINSLSWSHTFSGRTWCMAQQK